MTRLRTFAVRYETIIGGVIWHLIDLINHVTADDEENVCGDDANGGDCVSWLFVSFDDDVVPSDV